MSQKNSVYVIYHTKSKRYLRFESYGAASLVWKPEGATIYRTRQAIKSRIASICREGGVYYRTNNSKKNIAEFAIREIIFEHQVSEEIDLETFK